VRKLDVVVAALLVIGGLNWGVVGLLGFDLVGSLLGEMSPLSRTVYALVGLAAVYQGLGWKAIQRRWELAPSRA